MPRESGRTSPRPLRTRHMIRTRACVETRPGPGRCDGQAAAVDPARSMLAGARAERGREQQPSLSELFKGRSDIVDPFEVAICRLHIACSDCIALRDTLLLIRRTAVHKRVESCHTAII